MTVISLYPNPKRDENLTYTKLYAQRLLSLGGRVLVSGEWEHILKEIPGVEFVPEDDLFTRGECLITLGGDGTILSVAGRAAKADIPILGINLGKVGFMAALEKEETEKLEMLLHGKYTVSSRMLLSCQINGEEAFCALNECVVAPEKGLHIVELSLYSNEEKLCDFRADGLIFNTPTGSTGYAFSAGGAVMDSEMDCIGVKAISSYLLINAHHLIFHPETVFSVKGCRSEGGPVTVCADGRETRILQEGDVVSIRRSEKRVRLLFPSKRSNLEVFSRKF